MTAPQYTSEVDLLQCGHSDCDIFAIIASTYIVAGDNIEDRQNLVTSVTLTKHGDENLLRHSWFVEC